MHQQLYLEEDILGSPTESERVLKAGILMSSASCLHTMKGCRIPIITLSSTPRSLVESLLTAIVVNYIYLIALSIIWPVVQEYKKMYPASVEIWAMLHNIRFNITNSKDCY
jgi:hypothetical protein